MDCDLVLWFTLRQCFFTMKDVKSTAAFVQALNESLESGSLMCQLYSAELSKLLINMTNSFCREQLRQQIPRIQYMKKAAVCLGKQPDSDIWVLNDTVQLTGSGIKVAQEDSEFIWLGSMIGNRKLPNVAPASDAALVPDPKTHYRQHSCVPQASSQQQLCACIYVDC